MIDSGHELLKNTSGSMDLLDQDPAIDPTMLGTHNLRSRHMVIPWSSTLHIVADPVPIKVKKNKKNLFQETRPKKKMLWMWQKKLFLKKLLLQLQQSF